MLKFGLKLQLACSMEGCTHHTEVVVMVAPAPTAMDRSGQLRCFHTNHANLSRMKLPQGWRWIDADNVMCAACASPLPTGTKKPPEGVLKRARLLRTLAMHEGTPKHESENAWNSYRNLAAQYDLSGLEEEEPL